ncbi:MAG: MFS transporter [Cephaloticoccus sp.]|nr:MFS transporter [Cephaloticoccus sp.]MCF7759877.1 MFS transporter [Cephaloticoccus sp.]
MPLTLLSQPGNIVLAALLTGIFHLSARNYGLIVSLPFWFNFLQVLITPLLAERLDARRLCIISAWMHCLGWIFLTAAMPFLPMTDTPQTFWVFAIGFSVISMSSAINGVAWNGWMQEVVPGRLRGKYFGARNRLLYVSMITFLLSVSGLLALMDGSLVAYMVLFGLAIVLRVFSVFAQQHMTLGTGRQKVAPQLRWQDQVRSVRADPVLVKFIGFAALMGFTINLFGPFFPVFMYEELHITVAKANWILLFGPLGAAVSFPAWGRLVDKFGNIPVMVVALALWQIFNFIWCFVDTGNVWLLYVVSTTGGLFSAGYGIGVFNLLLKLTPPTARTMTIALFVSISCLAAAMGPPLGGYIISVAKARGFDPLTIYHVAFVFAPVFSLLNCLVLRHIREAQAARITDVVGAMRNVRTVASLFGLSFLVNQVFYRSGTRRRRAET